jgi:hypothetical protein
MGEGEKTSMGVKRDGDGVVLDKDEMGCWCNACLTWPARCTGDESPHVFSRVQALAESVRR